MKNPLYTFSISHRTHADGEYIVTIYRDGAHQRDFKALNLVEATHLISGYLNAIARNA